MSRNPDAASFEASAQSGRPESERTYPTESRNAAWLTPATSLSWVSASITIGWAPTASTRPVTAGAALFRTHRAPFEIEAAAAAIPPLSLPHIRWPPAQSVADADAHPLTRA